MIKHFIEFRGSLYVFDENVTNNEAWLYVYNSKKENIMDLVKIWTCVHELGCKYPAEIMEQVNALVVPGRCVLHA